MFWLKFDKAKKNLHLKPCIVWNTTSNDSRLNVADDLTRTPDKRFYCVRQPLRTFSACSKMWAVFHVWMWTPEERQTSASLTLGTSRAHALNSLCLNDAKSTHKKKLKKTIWVRIAKNAQAGSECAACFQRKVRINSALLTRWTHTVRIKPYNADVDDNSIFYQFVLCHVTIKKKIFHIVLKAL